MAVTNFHQTFMSGKVINQDEVAPVYWCVIPPKCAWSAGSFNLSFLSDETAMDKAGLIDFAGYVIPNAFGLNERFNMTPLQIRDKFLPMIDAQSFGVGNDITDDDRFASARETTLNDATDQPLGEDATPGDNVEGRDADSTPQAKQLLKHPAIFDQVNWLGVGARPFFQKSVPLGVPYGAFQPIDANTVRYQVALRENFRMMGSANGGISVVLIVASLPQLGASNAGPSDEVTERISPWATWATMLKSFLDAKDQFTDALLVTDPSVLEANFRELIAWKRTYNVGDDTWHNENGKVYLRASATLTSFMDEDRLHI